MRFIFNFILYGILFYLIYLFFPDAFATLVGWAQSVVEFLQDLYFHIAEKVHEFRQERLHSQP